MTAEVKASERTHEQQLKKLKEELGDATGTHSINLSLFLVLILSPSLPFSTNLPPPLSSSILETKGGQ